MIETRTVRMEPATVKYCLFWMKPAAPRYAKKERKKERTKENGGKMRDGVKVIRVTGE